MHGIRSGLETRIEADASALLPDCDSPTQMKQPHNARGTPAVLPVLPPFSETFLAAPPATRPAVQEDLRRAGEQSAKSARAGEAAKGQCEDLRRGLTAYRDRGRDSKGPRESLRVQLAPRFKPPRGAAGGAPLASGVPWPIRWPVPAGLGLD
jgi:hypothetical protein